jgi:hypothetical protein
VTHEPGALGEGLPPFTSTLANPLTLHRKTHRIAIA